MAFKDSFHKALVYFGLAEDRQYAEPVDEPDFEPAAQLEDRYRDRPNVRRLSSRRRRDESDDIFADDDDVGGRPTTVLRPVRGGGPGRNGGDVRVHLVHPKSFNDAQQIADKFK